MNDEIGTLGKLGYTWCKTTVSDNHRIHEYKQWPMTSKMPRTVSILKIHRSHVYLLYYVFLKKDLP